MFYTEWPNIVGFWISNCDPYTMQGGAPQL
jgi:hypothetical protein